MIRDLLKRLRAVVGEEPSVVKCERHYGRRTIGFTEDESTFSRIYFKLMKHRTAFIKMLISLEVPSYNNDLGSYYRVVARQNKLNLSGWNYLRNYRKVGTGEYRSKFTLEVDIADIQRYVEGDDITPWEQTDIRTDKAISMCWDIEQFSADFDVDKPNKPTRLPSGMVMEDTIFNIGMTFQFVNEPDSFLNLSLITKESKPHDDYITVQCDCEKTLLLAWAFILKLMQPEFIIEFNGSAFDWPNLVDKCVLYDILPDMADMMSVKALTKYEMNQDKIRRYSYKSDHIKLSADRTQTVVNLRMHGYVAIDLRVILMQLNPTESKSSLNFYLDKYGLSSKDDMPIPLLFTYFVTGDVEKLGDVAHYCYIDCFRLHQLLQRTNLIQDRRAVGLLSYTSVFDTFYRANGSKVRNIIAANAFDLNLFCNTIPKKVSEEDAENGKYPGALVLKPKRGLVKPTMTFKEFCEYRLEMHDTEVIEQGQQVIAEHYDTFFKNLEIKSIKEVEAILTSMGLNE